MYKTFDEGVTRQGAFLTTSPRDSTDVEGNPLLLLRGSV
jgi:hypothetical protein